MKKRFLALVMVCTMVMTVPVFAITVDQAKLEMNEVEAGIQGVKQWTDTTQINVNDANFRVDRAQKELAEAKDIAHFYVRPEGISDKEAEGQKKNLEKEAEEAKKYYDRCRHELKKAEEERKEAEKELQKQYHKLEKKKKALEAALSQIEKQFGKGSVMKLGEATVMDVEAIPTGSLSLDIALGIGGIPRGRIVEVYGPESSGKTTLTLHMIAEAQKLGGEAAFIDAEHALDPTYAKHLGVDIDNLIVSQPDTGEQALEIAEALVRSGALDIIVVDSVAALVPKAEIDGDMGDSHIGLQARLMSQALRKLAGAINKTKTVIIFINQLREKVGIMFGNPETTTGGRALKYYASVRLDIRKVENIKQDGEVTGNRAKVKVVKNKMAPPFREAEFDIVYGKGISKSGSILDLAVNLDIIEKSGSWFSYNGERIGQGRENIKKYLEDNPEVMNEIEEKVRDNYKKAFEQSLTDEEPAADDEEDQ